MSKRINSMTRLSGQLERMFKAINHDFFDDELETPTISIIPTARAYAHVSVEPIWQCGKDLKRRELNVSSSYLDRPLECICASVLHEAVHILNLQHNVQDTSNHGVYHNRFFRQEAEAHGLICTRTEKYGYSDTQSVLSDELIEWVLLHDEFREIELCRTMPGLVSIGGSRSADSGTIPTGTTRTSSTRKLACPCCKNSVRATKTVNILCGDCLVKMIEV